MKRTTNKQATAVPTLEAAQIGQMKKGGARKDGEHLPGRCIMQGLLMAAMARCLGLTRLSVRQSWLILQAEVLDVNQRRDVPLPMPSYRTLRLWVTEAKALNSNPRLWPYLDDLGRPSPQLGSRHDAAVRELGLLAEHFVCQVYRRHSRRSRRHPH